MSNGSLPQVIVPAVIGFTISKDRKFLLTKRHQPDAPIWHEKWNIPGGAIDWGETPREALIREFHEELGVVPTFLYPDPHPVTALWYGKDTGYKKDSHILLMCYLVDIGDQTIDLTLDPEKESSEYRWFTKDTLKEVQTLPKTVETVEYMLSLVDKHAILGNS